MNDSETILRSLVLFAQCLISAVGHLNQGRESLSVATVDKRMHEVNAPCFVDLAIDAFGLLDYYITDLVVATSSSKVQGRVQIYILESQHFARLLIIFTQFKLFLHFIKVAVRRSIDEHDVIEI